MSHHVTLLHLGVEDGANPLPGLLHFTLDTHLMTLSVKQGGIKLRFEFLVRLDLVLNPSFLGH